PQGEGLQPGPDAGGPETVLGKAIGQAAAVGQGGAVFVKPVDELPGKQLGPAAVEGGPLRVAVRRKGGVQHPVVLDGPGDVIVLLGAGAVGGPAVPAVVAVDARKATGHVFAIVGHPALFQGQVDQDHKELPVALGDLVVVDLVQPAGQVLLFRAGQGVPQFVGGVQQAAGDGGHLHKALVVVLAAAPVFGDFGGGAGGQAPEVHGFILRGGSARHPEGNQRPEVAAEGFQVE